MRSNVYALPFEVLAEALDSLSSVNARFLDEGGGEAGNLTADATAVPEVCREEASRRPTIYVI